MFSFFKKSTNKVTYSDKGSHGRHWYCLVGDRENVYNHFTHYFPQFVQSWPNPIVSGKTTIITNEMMRSLIVGDKLVSGFPCWKGTRYEQLEISSITEWSHVNGLEAIIHAGHQCGAAINFFAVDYAFNKDIYKNNKNITANVVAFAYYLEDCDIKQYKLTGIDDKEVNFRDDFCGYGPTDESDEINFIGIIHDVKEYSLDTVDGFIVNVAITPEFYIDIFIAQVNLEIELVKNKHITGLVWLIGTLE